MASDSFRASAARSQRIQSAVVTSLSGYESPCPWDGPSWLRVQHESDWQAYQRRDREESGRVRRGNPPSGYGWPTNEADLLLRALVTDLPWAGRNQASRPRPQAQRRSEEHHLARFAPDPLDHWEF